jgi:glycosyltransferase involved in cell wall biosynthesis
MSPMKMFEYMASGGAIISSSLPVLQEVLEDGRNALLVPPECPDAWVSALDRFLADPALASRLGATGHADYLAHYTWDQRAAALLAAATPF